MLLLLLMMIVVCVCKLNDEMAVRLYTPWWAVAMLHEGRGAGADCRLTSWTLPGVSIAEFGFRTKVKILDFGYRPEVLARIAGETAMGRRGANPPLEQFVIDYATCWPLIAASSITVLHDGAPFCSRIQRPHSLVRLRVSLRRHVDAHTTGSGVEAKRKVDTVREIGHQDRTTPI